MANQTPPVDPVQLGQADGLCSRVSGWWTRWMMGGTRRQSKANVLARQSRLLNKEATHDR
jgi:hypothetical protein